MRLIIAEKPDLGRAIASAILPGPIKKEKGYVYCGDTVVTWAFGHLFRLKAPEDYAPKYKRWNLPDLPIFFENWGMKPDPDKMEQIDLIGQLLKKAACVIHAGDPDDEGQLLIDEILDFFGYSGQVLRLSTNDLTPAVIQRAYANMVDNSAMRPLGESARARSVADFTLGINYSRYFTLKNHTLLSIGRVQTPTLGLVVMRDELIDGHKKIIHYAGYIHTRIIPNTLSALQVALPAGHSLLDDEGRVLDKNALEALLGGLRGKQIDIEVTKRTFDESPPLPFNLTKLQTAAFARFHYNPDVTLSITQSLREKYHLITYNRSTCQYLNDEQYAEAPSVISAVLGNLNATVPGLDAKRKSAAFNSKKVGESAHTGIIPTSQRADLSRLSEQEKNIYRLIAAQYLAQFMPPCRKETTRAMAGLPNGLTALASATRVVDKGYRAVLPKKDEAEEDAGLCSIPAGDYPNKCIEDVSVKERETKPPARYTLASLGEDMTRISKYVKDERIKKMLIAKDDGKEGENGSIGTPATRDGIVKNLIEREYIEVRGGKVYSTPLGREFYAVLPSEVKTADLTAEWWGIQEDIKAGKARPEDLYASINQSIRAMLATDYQGSGLGSQQKRQGAGVAGVCPICGNPVRFGKHGAYCSNYKDEKAPCKFRLGDTSFSKKLTEAQMKSLLAGKRVLIRGLVSMKTKRPFDAYLKLTGETNESGYARIGLDFEGVPPKKKNTSQTKRKDTA